VKPWCSSILVAVARPFLSLTIEPSPRMEELPSPVAHRLYTHRISQDLPRAATRNVGHECAQSSWRVKVGSPDSGCELARAETVRLVPSSPAGPNPTGALHHRAEDESPENARGGRNPRPSSTMQRWFAVHYVPKKEKRKKKRKRGRQKKKIVNLKRGRPRPPRCHRVSFHHTRPSSSSFWPNDPTKL